MTTSAHASAHPANDPSTPPRGPSLEEGVAILGLGASGMAAARLALQHTERVYVSELRTDTDAATRAGRLRAMGADVDLGAHDLARLQEASVVVVSPGIPPEAEVLRELRGRGVRWISEPEFAARFYQGPLIAITGTNGKTTTAALIEALLISSGFDAALGGNVGGGLAPAASELAVREPPPDWYVLEVSSFQLADTERFAPDIGVVTTLAPDHLDRYPNTEAYYADKARLFRNARPGDRWVLNGEVAAVRALPGDAVGARFFTALDPDALDPAEPGAFIRDGVMTLRFRGPEGTALREESLIPVSALGLLGRHNLSNALMAALTARLAGGDLDGIRGGLSGFRALPHRMEPVGRRAGVLWINDSKATNVDAARSAIESLDRPLVVILGGKDKGEDFGPLAAALEGRAHAVVPYGQAASRLRRELKGLGDIVLTLDEPAGFDQAVEVAAQTARPGDILLLSPACSSFDLFEDYQARGRRFAELVRGKAVS
jgi:UDP-N-acetylmuramoylalanine--D-glutamate ligase